MRDVEIERAILAGLNTTGIHLLRAKFEIDLSTGKTRMVGSSPGKRTPFKFDDMWIRRAHDLLMRLVNVRSGDEQREWEDLLNFFLRCGYLPYGKPWNPSEQYARSERLVTLWRKYRALARDLVSTPYEEWWSEVTKRHPQWLVRRALQVPPIKVDRDEIFDPLDTIWIAAFYGKVKGIEWHRCATKGCERYAPAYWRKGRGRPQRYCDSYCEDRDRKARKRKCLIILRQALRALPEKKRKTESERDRAVLAIKLWGLTSKQLIKIARRCNEQWIAEQLKKGVLNAQA